MNKIIGKMYLRALLKIVFSILLAVLVIYMLIIENDDIVISIVVGGLWFIVVIIYFISGIIMFKNGTSQLNYYIEKTGYTKKELNDEYKKSKKFGSLYIGNNHTFLVSSTGFYIVPINDIETINYLHLGENKFKGRPGHYYLYIKGEKIEDNIKIYFASKSNLNEAMTYLISKNTNIKEI